MFNLKKKILVLALAGFCFIGINSEVKAVHPWLPCGIVCGVLCAPVGFFLHSAYKEMKIEEARKIASIAKCVREEVMPVVRDLQQETQHFRERIQQINMQRAAQGQEALMDSTLRFIQHSDHEHRD